MSRRYYAQIEVDPAMIWRSAVDIVQYVEDELRDKIRRAHGDEAAERGRVVWTARLDVEVDT